MSIKAVAHISQVRGGSQARIMLADDGKNYVTKLMGNPQCTRVLANDYLACRLARMIGLSVPEPVIILVDEKTILEQQITFILAGRAVAGRPGLQFGSALVAGEAQDWLPGTMLGRVRNLREFAGLLAFDKWTGNADGRQVVFHKEMRERKYTASFIDFGYCFNAGEWSFPDAPLRGVYGLNDVYERIESWDDFAPWLSQIERFPERQLHSIADEIPNRGQGRAACGVRSAHLQQTLDKSQAVEEEMRNAGRLKLGYYPLPVEEAQNIRALLMSSAPYSAIDPCAGDGAALIEITKDTDAHLTAIELDADRAEAANRNGVATVHGSAFECRLPAETCSLLYLNPPYDNEFGPHSNKRMELVFLEHCYRWVTTEGALVFVVPAPAVGTCARPLTSQFDRICVFRLEHPESVRFNQVVVFGRRKKAHLRGESTGADELLRIAYRPQLLPVLNHEVVERYAIPPSSPTTITYTGLPLDAIEDALQRSVAMQNARGILVRKQQKMSGRTVTPLHKGHVGLLACSGMLNGFFGEGETRHIAHWRSVKYVDQFNEEGEAEGETIIRKRERFSHELTLAYESGQIIELKETKEAKPGDEERS